jgi:predicted RNase H-like HicB family nuclease
VKSYSFKVKLQEDLFPDGTTGYHVSVPSLEHLGAATQGRRREEALRNIQEVLEMLLEELAQEGKPVPRDSAVVSEEPVVTVTV